MHIYSGGVDVVAVGALRWVAGMLAGRERCRRCTDKESGLRGCIARDSKWIDRGAGTAGRVGTLAGGVGPFAGSSGATAKGTATTGGFVPVGTGNTTEVDLLGKRSPIDRSCSDRGSSRRGGHRGPTRGALRGSRNRNDLLERRRHVSESIRKTFEGGLKPVQVFLTDLLDGIYARACALCEVLVAFIRRAARK